MKGTLSKIRKSAKNQSNHPKTSQAKSEEREPVNSQIYAEKVEKKAYELYEKKGRQESHDWEDWFEAQKIVEAEMISAK